MKDIFNHNNNITYAFNSEGSLVNIKDVYSGKKCNCFCTACKEPLMAKKGESRKHHFAHLSKTNCVHAFESMLHHLAKDKIQKAFNSNNEFWINYEEKKHCFKIKNCEYISKKECSETNNKKVNLKEFYDSCEQEVCYDNIRRRSDLKIFSSTNKDKKPIYLEFCVTHACDYEKLHSGNAIIEIVIESEEDIDDIINNGIIETKECNKQLISKVAFYSFEKKSNDISTNIEFIRFILSQDGELLCYKDYKKNCKNFIKNNYKTNKVDLCFHIPHEYENQEEILSTMKYLCYQKYKIKNCDLCVHYKHEWGAYDIKKDCGINKEFDFIESYETKKTYAKQCEYFKIDEEEMENKVKGGFEDLDDKILSLYANKNEYYLTNLLTLNTERRISKMFEKISKRDNDFYNKDNNMEGKNK